MPIRKIIDRYFKSLSLCEQAVELVHRGYIYDNSQENTTPQLLFRIYEGKLIKQYVEIPFWAKDILRKVQK